MKKRLFLFVIFTFIILSGSKPIYSQCLPYYYCRQFRYPRFFYIPYYSNIGGRIRTNKWGAIEGMVESGFAYLINRNNNATITNLYQLENGNISPGWEKEYIRNERLRTLYGFAPQREVLLNGYEEEFEETYLTYKVENWSSFPVQLFLENLNGGRNLRYQFILQPKQVKDIKIPTYGNWQLMAIMFRGTEKSKVQALFQEGKFIIPNL